MKHIIIGDLHLENEKKYDNMHKPFFAWVRSEFGNREYILDFLGDIFDKRRSTNNFIIDKTQEEFDLLSEVFFNIRIIPGNHDIYTSHTLDNNNIMKNLFKHNSKISVYNEITIKDNLIYFPFNFKGSEGFEKINNMKNKKKFVLLGHFELENVYPSKDSEELPITFFEKFHYAFAGHYHTSFEKKNFRYVGTPIELSHTPKKDVIHKRGVWFLDDETFEMEFIEYPDYRQFFNFSIETEDEIDKVIKETKNLENKNIRIFVETSLKNQMNSILDLVVKDIKLNNEIKISTYDKKMEIENFENVDEIALLSDDDVKKVIDKIIDINYKLDDIKEFKKFTSNILSEFYSS